MAMMDYKWCDLCGCKVFYDSNVDYEWNTGEHGALCKKCGETHRLIIQPRGDDPPRNSKVVE